MGKMTEDLIVRAMLCDLNLGVIQLWQVSSTLERKGVYSFDNERLTRQIIEAYQKEHPCC